MPVKAKASLDKRFQKRLKLRFENYVFDVGVLENRPHKQAKAGVKTLAGGPARKISSRSSGLSVAQVSEEARKNTGINFYTRPWKSVKNREITRFVYSFFKMVSEGGKLTEKKRLENLLQAVVRNPITRGDYGGNRSLTAKIKGFSRLLIDTGQLFRSIKASVRRKR